MRTRRTRRWIAKSTTAVAALEEAIGDGDAVIAIEGSHVTGQLFLLELLARRHDVREFHQSSQSGSARRSARTTPTART